MKLGRHMLKLPNMHVSHDVSVIGQPRLDKQGRLKCEQDSLAPTLPTNNVAVTQGMNVKRRTQRTLMVLALRTVAQQASDYNLSEGGMPYYLVGTT
jgi:hypothetical protein